MKSRKVKSRKSQVSNPQRLYRSFHVVSTDDVGAAACHDHLGGQRTVKAVCHWSVLAVQRQRASDKRFSRDARQQGKSQLVKFVEAPQQRIIFLKALAETKTRIEHDVITLDFCQQSGVGPGPQFPL